MHATSPAGPLSRSFRLATLVVDQEGATRMSLERLLGGLGHEVIVVASASEALIEASRRKLACIIVDTRQADRTAGDLVAAMLEHEPSAAVIVLGDNNDAAAAVDCLRRGAMDYLVKPCGPGVLELAIARAMTRRRDQIEHTETHAWLQREKFRQDAELRRERENLQHISVAALEALVNALEAKDPYLRGHSARIADLSAMVAAELGMNDEQVELVRVAGRLHDIGKIGIRESVLGKRGPLTSEEFDHVKSHVLIGAQILAPLTHLRDVISYVRSHHERDDGTGYPDSLAGETIPVGARILGAAEVFDALTTARPYQDKMSPEEAVARMRDLIGTVIGAEVHRALSTVISRRGPLVFLDDRDAREQQVTTS
jgi:putative two-component system response regulator